MATHGIEDICDLSPIQQGMLFHVLSDPESRMYIEQGVCTLSGKLDRYAFNLSWQEILNRHTALRTAFLWRELSRPVQVIYCDLKIVVDYYDQASLHERSIQNVLDECLKSHKEHLSDLSAPPLIRLATVQVSELEHKLICSIHHLVHDAWSLEMMLGEFVELYESFSNGLPSRLPPAKPYRDYIRWIKNQDYSEAQRYWSESLKGFTPPPKLFDRSNSKSGGGIYAVDFSWLDPDITETISQQARNHHLTLNTVLQAVWALLLSQISSANDIVFGSIVSGRPSEIEGVERMVGVFINTLPIRVVINRETALIDWFQEIQEILIKARQYEHMPLSEILKWSKAPRGAPLFETIFVLQNVFSNQSGLKAGGITLGGMTSSGHPNYPLMIRITPSDRLLIEVVYDSTLVDHSAARKLLSNYTGMLREVATMPQTTLSNLISTLEEGVRRERRSSLGRHKQLFSTKLKTTEPKIIRLSESSNAEGEGID